MGVMLAYTIIRLLKLTEALVGWLVSDTPTTMEAGD